MSSLRVQAPKLFSEALQFFSLSVETGVAGFKVSILHLEVVEKKQLCSLLAVKNCLYTLYCCK